jgi:hypothetical protein
MPTLSLRFMPPLRDAAKVFVCHRSTTSAMVVHQRMMKFVNASQMKGGLACWKAQTDSEPGAAPPTAHTPP